MPSRRTFVSALQAALAERYSMKEIRWVATLEIAKLQKQCDDLAKRLRDINAVIQATNWGTDIA